MSSRKLTVKTENWSEEPFAISRGSDNNFDVVVVELEQNGCRGCGEATPTEHNQESVSQSEMLIENIGRQINLYFKMWNCFFDYTPHSIWGKKLTCAGAKSEHLPNSHKKYFHIKK